MCSFVYKHLWEHISCFCSRHFRLWQYRWSICGWMAIQVMLFIQLRQYVSSTGVILSVCAFKISSSRPLDPLLPHVEAFQPVISMPDIFQLLCTYNMREWMCTFGANHVPTNLSWWSLIQCISQSSHILGVVSSYTRIGWLQTYHIGSTIGCACACIL